METSKIHKSIYAMLNVVHALSASGNHVPYRESKLTHLLQDSLRGANRVLMVTCLVRVVRLVASFLFLVYCCLGALVVFDLNSFFFNVETNILSRFHVHGKPGVSLLSK